MKQICILLAYVCISWNTYAQLSLKGTVTGSGNESLIGAHVTLNNSFDQRVTGNDGSFEFTGLRPGTYRLKVSYIGYEGHDEVIRFKNDTTAMIRLNEDVTVSDAVIIMAVRATQNTPTTFTIIGKEEITQNNTIQDLPYLLNLEPSVVSTSDAGNGIGYTGIRIRGSDMTRINATINGIPLNDPESHAVYWVDVPDIAGSLNSIQIQRGIGSSTNGAGAFGASMNMETNTFKSKPFGAISLGAGSFNSRKVSFQAGTGLMKDHWYMEARGSSMASDGYIDRASSELSSYFVQGGYYDDKMLIKAIAFGGREKTYQAWYGIDAYTMGIDRTFNWAGAIFNDDGSISYYDNQTDNYTQNHYQLHVSRQLTSDVNLNLSGHYTRGSGYYEEYRQDDSFADYGLSNLYFGRDSLLNGTEYEYFFHDTITNADLIRRRWLDNHYYGITWSLRYKKPKTELVIGGGVNKYDKARHFGEIIWAEYALDAPKDHEYYNNTSFKTDFNIFVKTAWNPTEILTLYGDVQYRMIHYKNHGIESHLNPTFIDEVFQFLNPKAGINYSIRPGTIYVSYAIAHREPIRDDFIDALPGEKPRAETLHNVEFGMRKNFRNWQYSVNYFYMNYRDQLVLTGEINDDGAYIRRNAGKSFRTGIEMAAAARPVRFVEISGSLSMSRNRTDYKQPDAEGAMIIYKNTPISFSPGVTGSSKVGIFPLPNLEIDWIMKYVGKQFLDNTGNESLSLDHYLVQDSRITFLISGKKIPDVEVSLMVNNIFDISYESNGAVYDNEPYYYPQAGRNLMAGIRIIF